MTDFRTFVGIDVSKDTLEVHIRPEGTGFQVANSRRGLALLRRRLARRADVAGMANVAIALEATGGYERLAATSLAKAGWSVFVLHAGQVRTFARSLRRLAKTDALDAGVIAQMLEVAHPDLVAFQADPHLRRLAELVAYRDGLVREATRTRGALDTLEDPDVRRALRTRLGTLKMAVVRIERTIAERIAATPRWAAVAARLAPIPGVGPVLISVLIARLPELGQIPSRALAALVGVAPHPRQSGKRDFGGRCQGGRPAIRRVLYMATLAAIACRHPQLRPFYDRLKATGKPPKAAIVAAMRKFLTIINAVVRDDQPWCHQT